MSEVLTMFSFFLSFFLKSKEKSAKGVRGTSRGGSPTVSLNHAKKMFIVLMILRDQLNLELITFSMLYI